MNTYKIEKTNNNNTFKYLVMELIDSEFNQWTTCAECQKLKEAKALLKTLESK